MIGDFKLDGVYYKALGGTLPNQMLANQMASKVGQGTSEYADLTSWSAWIQQDWTAGVGKVKPHLSAGYLYGELESRVPGQLILPPKLNWTDKLTPTLATTDCRSLIFNMTVAGDLIVGNGGRQRIAIPFKTPATLVYTTSMFWILASIPDDVEVTMAIYTNSAGAPNTLMGSAVAYTPPDGPKGYYFHGKTLPSGTTLSTNTDYWLVVYPTSGSDSFKVMASSLGYATATMSYNGASWSSIASTYALFSSQVYATTPSTNNRGSGVFRFNGTLYAYLSNQIYKTTDYATWTSVGAITGHSSTSGATVYIDKVFFGNGGLTTTTYTTMGTAETFSASGLNGHLFARHDGLLWRAYSTQVEYSDDGVTWEPTATLGSPITVTDTSAPITGLCGMGDSMYVSTKEGLIRIFPGDLPKSAVRFGSASTDNGMDMVNFEGALYIIVNGRVIRYTEDGTHQDVWLTREDDLLAGAIGRVWDLEVTNNWLFALVGPTITNGRASIWAYQDNSWHPIAQLPTVAGSSNVNYRDYSLYYDVDSQYLWVTTPLQLIFRFYIPNYTLNPYNDPVYEYAYSGWTEWDWFDSPILEADKDYESVTLMSENINDDSLAYVYWKDDDSTDWELLGCFNENNMEIRWDKTRSDRPNTKRFKLGLQITSFHSSASARIRAIRVKYHLMVKDWFRWSLQVDVSGRSGSEQMMLDEVRNTYTASQIKALLDAVCKATPPIIYIDVDGTQYEVKVNDGNFSYTKNVYENSAHYWEGVYRLTIEQVTSAPYTP